MKTGIELIAEERQRQIEKEGYSIDRDAKIYSGESEHDLCFAAAAYALPEQENFQDSKIVIIRESLFPWDKEWWKPSPNDRIRELQKAGALLAAEIDRINKLNVANS